MLLNIQKFILILVVTLLSVLYFIFAYNHLDQREKTALVILKSLNSQISETSYNLSKILKERQEIVSSRSLLDRVSANNDFIKTILISDDSSVLITTDPSYRKIVSKDQLVSHASSTYEQLMEIEAIQSEIRFYTGRDLNIYNLAFILDKNEIHSHFGEKQMDFLIYFGLLPIIILFFMWFVLRSFVVKPLERLRQFAYYQNKIPKAFKLKELEIIRYSMVQTFQRLENEKKELYAMARTDTLSGLANRNALNEYLERLINTAKREDKEFAFLFLDLDHFKTINDSLGHNVGDELLQNVASIIDEVIRSSDFVARVGGDEFVIVIQEYESILELTGIVNRIQNRLSETMIVQTHPINVNSSVGIAFFPKDGEDILSLMKHSDIAMYEAKEKGRAQYHFFTEELNKRVQDLIALDKDMRLALDNDEYQLYYQPKVDVVNGEIIGAEALIRWISPTKGIIPPDTFIPLAEENGFILKLGEWVSQEAIKQHKIWKEKGMNISISINISTKQLLMDEFGTTFIDLLEKNDVNPQKIDIEITEYMFLQHNTNNPQVLNKLHDYGVSISLDDFGTGYSSLSYLKRFPIDYLKIDKSFLDDYNTEKGAIFIETIVKMGQTLNMKVIAEGVELKEQLDYLKSIGCNQYQGYYFSKPLPVDNFEEFYLKHLQISQQ